MRSSGSNWVSDRDAIIVRFEPLFRDIWFGGRFAVAQRNLHDSNDARGQRLFSSPARWAGFLLFGPRLRLLAFKNFVSSSLRLWSIARLREILLCARTLPMFCLLRCMTKSWNRSHHVGVLKAAKKNICRHIFSFACFSVPSGECDGVIIFVMSSYIHAAENMKERTHNFFFREEDFGSLIRGK